MDAFGAEHMRKWIDYQFEREDTETRDQLQADMAERFEQDPEFWGGQSYWTLYHAVMEERARETVGALEGTHMTVNTRKLAGIGTAEFLRSVVTAEHMDAGEADEIRGAAFRAIPGLMRRRIAQDVTAAALRELAGEYPAIAHACQSLIFTRRR